MNIQTVAENLRNTIKGKEKYLAECKDALDKGITSTGVHIAVDTTREFLEINIDELKRILQDVEQCVKQASDDSWITNPDRMGGGGWTADELDPNRGWK
jgi:flagellar biosynthesis chaperone FliJ